MIRLAFAYSDEIDVGEVGMLAPLFSVAGFSVEAVRWDDPTVQWGRFEAILVRGVPSAAGSSLAFSSWLRDALQFAPVFNAPEIIGWNADRGHLLEYGERGVVVPEMAVVQSVDEARLSLASFDASQVWVRSRGWGARLGPFPTGGEEVLASVSGALGSSQAVLLEGHLRGDDGQRIVFVSMNGRLSHAVARPPEGGDAAEPHSPSEGLVLAADYAQKVSFDIWEEKSFSQFAQVPLFGNFEFLTVNEEPILTQVDFIQPELFLDVHPYGAAKLFNAFLQQRNGSDNVGF
jgi:O-ureido-D-serine cyclo-ligase